MAATHQPVNIFLASSGDLRDERDFCEVLFNRIGKAHPHLHLEPIRWEIDLESGSVNAARIQDAINPLLDASDVVVLLCYSRIGTFTVEEYRRTLDAGKKLFVYFKTGFSPKNRSEHTAYGEILALREEIEAENIVLFKDFGNNDQLENLIRHDFGLFLSENYPARQAVVAEKPSRFLTVIPHPGFVTGRDALLAAIHHVLQTSGTAALVRGIGGIGKTTAALAYLHHDTYGGRYDHIAWVEILTTLPDAFAARHDLHERLGILPNVEALLGQNDADGVVRATLDALRRLDGQTLLALDNANDRDEIRRWKRALTNCGCRLLLTSRADIPNVADVPVEELDAANAAALFYHHYRSGALPPTEGPEAEALLNLLNEVQRHTLLVEMLGKIGKQARMSVADLHRYVADGYVFSKKLQRTVDTGSLTERKSPGLDETTLENLVLFLFRGLAPGLTDAERDLLRQIAVLPPTAHAPKLLVQLFGITEDMETDFFETLDRIDKRGVPLRKDDVYQLHHLVRAVALRELTPTLENCAAVLQNVTNLLRIDQARDNPVDKFPVVGYGETLLEVLEEPDGQQVSLLQTNLALVYKAMGNYERARKMLEAALASNLKHFGPDHPTTAIGQSILATIYRYLGTYGRAQELGEAALKSVLKHFGPDDRTVAVIRSDLAIVYSEIGDYEQARELAEAALASDLKNYGPNHPAVAIRQSILSAVYQNLGNYEQARDLLEAALASDLKHFGLNHPNVATRQSNLATVYYNLGNYERARELLEAVLSSKLKYFSPDHPNVAISRNNLAHVEIKVGNWSAAKEQLQQALTISLRAWGEGHPSVLNFRQTLAYVDSQLQKN